MGLCSVMYLVEVNWLSQSEHPVAETERRRVIFPPVIAILHDGLLALGGWGRKTEPVIKLTCLSERREKREGPEKCLIKIYSKKVRCSKPAQVCFKKSIKVIAI